jgi:hypothetical protein
VTAALELLDRCRKLGIVLAAGPDGTLAWEADVDPPAGLLAELVAAKVELLALLAWDQVKAAALIAELQQRRRQLFGDGMWPSDRDSRRRLSAMADSIDAAWTAQDMVQLRKAIAAYLDALGGAAVRQAEACDAGAATPAGRSGGLFPERPAGPYNERS